MSSLNALIELRQLLDSLPSRAPTHLAEVPAAVPSNTRESGCTDEPDDF